MDPMIDLVRDRTSDLLRVAASIRRERDLRQRPDEMPVEVPTPTPFPTGVPAAAMACDEAQTAPAARRAA